MFELLAEKKVMRDPIHEYIHIQYKVIWDSIDSPEFQRLRRIHQLGPTFQVYHTAEHSRFSHSLGVYEIVRRMVEEVEGVKERLSEFERVAVMLAGLLHDLGHGPFSHAFELIQNHHHEYYTEMILLGDSRIHEILANADINLPKAVADIIAHRHQNKLLTQMISGQLDADRMDYLLRDAYFTGTSYGQFDLERILRTLRVADDRLVVKESGIHTVEDYIMARYHMYWQVYYHPVSRSFEAVLTSFFRRMKDLYHHNPLSLAGHDMFTPFLRDEIVSIEDYVAMDEPAFMYGMALCRKHPDKILSDLARRLLTRELFGYSDIDNEKSIVEMKKKVEACGYDSEYYLTVDRAKQQPYQPYRGKESSLIWVMLKDGRIRELSDVSVIVQAIVKGEDKSDRKMFFPKTCIEVTHEK
jgi:uncharacterized protein